MVGASKILTVSYGTFSCTLEGFDDPFSTMKSIAEYFRDLAAEDRFFGAEPPTPDVSHLHALAEATSARRVSAELEDNGLRLTQERASVEPTPAPQPAPQQTLAAPQPAPAETAPTQIAMDSDDDDAPILAAGDLDEDDLDLDEDENVFDVPPAAEDTKAKITAKLQAARAAMSAADGTAASRPRRARTPDVSQDDLDAAASRVMTRDAKRPDAFRQDIDTLNADASGLSREEEADLLAELDALSQDAGTTEQAPAKEGRALLESDLIEREEAALDRLLAKTNSKLTDADIEQKRASLSHLKAAVAATIADRDGEAVGPDEAAPDEAYRADLQKVVKPKPEGTKPTPLVLVANRDAASAAAPKTPVRPRRVEGQRSDETRRDSDSQYAAYAKKLGVRDLNDMMEAAAAYLNTVEGLPSFTRPQVMHMVLRHEMGKTYTREDSLRSFDGLVRRGLIEKVGQGQFAIKEESRYVS